MLNEIEQEYEAQEDAQDFTLNETAVRLAIKLIKLAEGCVLRAYPDAASPLSEALSNHNLLNAYKQGKAEIPEGFEKLPGKPWTIGFGTTGKDIVENLVWTQQEADSALQERVRVFMQATFKITPNLFLEAPERQAAIIDLVYNIGESAYARYAISKLVQSGNHVAVAAKLKQYVYAGDRIMPGLVARRQREADLYMSVGN